MFTRSKHGENRLWHQKTLSLILAVIMIAGTLVLPISSTDVEAVSRTEREEPTRIAEEAWTPELSEGDLPLDLLGDARLADSDIPAVISRELTEARHHVNRLYEQEPDDYTVMFQNRDGSKTIYIFSVPVKNTDVYAERLQASDMTSAVGVAISAQSNGKATLSLQSGGLASRLGNSQSSEPLYDYNIGSCELIRFGTVLTSSAAASGTDITASAQEWGRSREGAAGTFAIDAAKADELVEASMSDTASNELICFTMTYSTLAGEYALKNSDKYLYNQLNSLRMTSYLGAPEGKWLFSYQSNGTYRIRSQSNQTKYLTATNITVSLSESTGTDTFWYCDFNAGTISPYGNTSYSIDSTLVLSAIANAGTWSFTNYVSYVDVSSITITPSGSTQALQSILARDGESYHISVTYSPSNATYQDIDLDLPGFVKVDDAVTELVFNDSGEGTISFGYKYNTSRCTGTIPVTVAPSGTPARFGNMIFTISQGSGSNTRYITVDPDTSDVTWETNSRLAAAADSSVIKRPDDYDTQFYVSPVTGTDLYTVKSISANKYLTAGSTYPSLSATVTSASAWRIIELANGNVMLWNPSTTGMLCTESSESLLVGDGYDAAEWDLRIAGVYRVQNASTGKYMTVKDGYDTDLNNGDNPKTINIVTESMNAAGSERDLDSNQHFRIVYKNGSYLLYPICSMNGSRRVIGKATVGTGQVILKNYGSSAMDGIDIAYATGGKYCLKYGSSYAMADVSNNVQYAAFSSGTASQQWVLSPDVDRMAEEVYYANVDAIFPVDISPLTITSGYGHRKYPNAQGGISDDFHSGLDVGVSEVNLLAPFSGEVVYTSKSTSTDVGMCIVIKSNQCDDLYAIFYHLSYVGVSTGSFVTQGQSIGTTGATGTACAGAHLHYTISRTQNNNGYTSQSKTFDPLWIYPNMQFAQSESNKTDSIIIGGETQ